MVGLDRGGGYGSKTPLFMEIEEVFDIHSTIIAFRGRQCYGWTVIEMGIERADLEDVAGDFTHALVEVVGKFWSMVAHCMGLEDCRWLE